MQLKTIVSEIIWWLLDVTHHVCATVVVSALSWRQETGEPASR